MANLTYMIFEENRNSQNFALHVATPSDGREEDYDDGAQGLTSTNQLEPSACPPAKQPRTLISIGTVAPRPPCLRDLIEESGILQELERDNDLRPILEEESVENLSEGWRTKGGTTINAVDHALQKVVHEVLSMDDQDLHSSFDAYSSASQSSEMIRAPQRMPSSSPSVSRQLSMEASSVDKPTPQVEPQFSSPVVTQRPQLCFDKYSPPPIEDAQPSRSIPTKGTKLPLGRPPLARPPLATGGSIPKGKASSSPSPETRGSIDSDRNRVIPRQIARADSIESYQTMVSEITLPLEMTMAQLRIDPRAPQFQMAMDQQKNTKGSGETTMRTQNHSFGTPNLVKPPTRNLSPPRENVTTLGSMFTQDISEVGEQDPYEITPTFGFPIDNETPPLWLDKVARKGTIGGGGAAPLPASQPQARPLPASQPQGPFISPHRSTHRIMRVPNSPQQNSNPLLFPGNLVSPSEHSDSDVSIAGPFVSPSVVTRQYRVRPRTPQHDSNPLLFPQGIEYYPPSPATSLPQPQRQASPIPVAPEEPNENSKTRLSHLVLPLTNHKAQLHQEKTSSAVQSQSSGQSSAETSELSTSGSDDVARVHSNAVLPQPQRKSTLAPTRVKLSPREIVYIVNGQREVHTGLYSGPINRENQPHGNGVFWFGSGDLYLGQFVEGHLHGVGAMSIVYKDGSKVIQRGIFQHNEFVGLGGGGGG